jgi:hypothetical protein
MMGILSRDKSERLAELGKEIHAISCASKPVSSWTTQKVILLFILFNFMMNCFP